MFQVPDNGGDGLGWVDAVLYQCDLDHVLEGIVDEVLGTSNLLQMVLWVMEGQIRGDYFPDYILDPSVIDCTAHPVQGPHRGRRSKAESSWNQGGFLNLEL